MRYHASISYTVAPENIPIFACNEENWNWNSQNCFISVKQIICAFKSIEKTEMHSENERNTGVESVSEPNKCKIVLGTNTKTWKMRNPYDVTGKLGSDQMGGG